MENHYGKPLGTHLVGATVALEFTHGVIRAQGGESCTVIRGGVSDLADLHGC